jgi:hypothetical protein
MPLSPSRLIGDDLQSPQKTLAIPRSMRNTIPPGGNPNMSLRLIVWPLCMAYVAFLLAGTKGAFSPGIAITAAFLGAMIGFCLGIMFANRALRRHRENVPGVNVARTFR